MENGKEGWIKTSDKSENKVFSNIVSKYCSSFDFDLFNVVMVIELLYEESGRKNTHRNNKTKTKKS
jgi:hypothetical protein